VYPNDKIYKETCAILLGKKALAAKKQDFINWANETFNIEVLNFEIEQLTIKNTFSLQLVFRETKDFETLYVEYNYLNKRCYRLDLDIEAKLLEKYCKINQRMLDPIQNNGDISESYIFCDDFNSTARRDLLEQIKVEEIEHIFKDDKDIYMVYRFFSSIDVFFYTNKQCKAYQNSGKLDEYRTQYYNFVKPKDVFDVIKHENIALHFSSKEILDKQYGGNLYYYYK